MLDKLVGITTQAVVALLYPIDVIISLTQHWYLFLYVNFDIDLFERGPLVFRVIALCGIRLLWFAMSLTYLGVGGPLVAFLFAFLCGGLH
jgi:hypothetical protein